MTFGRQKHRISYGKFMKLAFAHCQSTGWNDPRIIRGSDLAWYQVWEFTHPDGVKLTACPFYLWQLYLRGEPLDSIFLLDKGINMNH